MKPPFAASWLSGELLLTRTAGQIIDQAYVQVSGLPLALLMEQAAAAAKEILMTRVVPRSATDVTDYPVPASLPGYRILFLAGGGMNGGDSWAFARQVWDQADVAICDLAPNKQLPPAAAANRAAWQRFQRPVLSAVDVLQLAQRPHIVVDGVFGSGFRAARGIPAEIADVFERIRDWQCAGTQVLALDLPSGLDCDTAELAAGTLYADHTVTFVRQKLGLAGSPGCQAAGAVHVASLGLADDWLCDQLPDHAALPRFLTAPLVSGWGRSRPADGHKGSFGRACLIGGQAGSAGAIVLASRACAQSGCGYTHTVVPDALLPVFLDALPEALLIGQGDLDPLVDQRLLKPGTALGIGPGSGQDPWLIEHLRHLILQADSLVLDADGLNLLAAQSDWQAVTRARWAAKPYAPLIITPHPGEFARLAPELKSLLSQDRVAAARSLAKSSGTLVVLKGARTVLAAPNGPVLINSSGNNGLAKGGSGDVLTGLITGLLAQGYDCAAAAAAGVFLHGLAADILAVRQESSRGILPHQLLEALPQAFLAVHWDAPVTGCSSDRWRP